LAVSGSTVYVGGAFTRIGNQTRNRIAVVDAASGEPLDWDPGTDGTVSALAVDGATVYVGGHFTSVGEQVRSNVAAVDALTGIATPWDPSANGDVYALAPRQGVLYVGGDFTAMGGVSRNHIACVDEASGAVTAWDPNAAGKVYALAVQDATVYAGGDFTQIGGQARNWIAALDQLGMATPWNPNAGDGYPHGVFSLMACDPLVYVGGGFTTIGGGSGTRLRRWTCSRAKRPIGIPTLRRTLRRPCTHTHLAVRWSTSEGTSGS